MLSKALRVLNKIVVIVLVLEFTFYGMNFILPESLGAIAYAADNEKQVEESPLPTDDKPVEESPLPTDDKPVDETPMPTEEPIASETPASTPEATDEMPADVPPVTEEVANAYIDVNAKELVDKRTESNKFFLLDNGKLEAVLFGYPVHYLKDGKYVDIDNSLSLVTDKDGKKKYENKENSFKANISEKSDWVSISKDNYKLTWSIDGIDTAKSASDVKVNMTKEDWAKLKEGEKRSNIPNIASGLMFKSIKAGIDLEYVVVGNKLKENIILNEKTDIQNVVQRIKADNLNLKKNDDNSITAYDEKSGNVIFEIPTPFMSDSDGNTNQNIEVSLDNKGKGNNYNLTYTLDAKWLETAVYPVIIDPAVTVPYGNTCVWDNRIAERLPGTNYKNSYMMCTGNGSSSGINYSLIKFLMFPNFDGCRIIDANLTVTMNNSATVSSNIGACKITSPWDDNVVWSTRPSFADPEQILTKNTTNHAILNFNIPAMANDWRYNNYGVLLRDMSTPYKGWATWNSTSDSGPILSIYCQDIAAPYDTSVSYTELSHSGRNINATLNFTPVADSGAYPSGVQFYTVTEPNLGYSRNIGPNECYNPGTGKYEIPLTLLDNTTYNFKVQATDNGWNSNAGSSYQITTPDYTGPNTTSIVLKNSQGSVISGATKETQVNVNWQMTDIARNLQTVWYAIYRGSTQIQAYTPASTTVQLNGTTYSGSFPISFASLSDDTYSIKVKGTDSSGNDGTCDTYATYIKDTKIDTMTLGIQNGDFTQANNEIFVNKSQINVLLNVADNHNIQSWRLEYGAGSSPLVFTQLASGQNVNSYNGSYNWDISALPNKIYTLRLYVKDGAGNETTEGSLTVPYTKLKFKKVFIGIPATLKIDTPPESQGTILSPNVNISYSRIGSGSTSTFTGNLYVNNEKQQPTDVQNGGGFTLDIAQQVNGRPKYPDGGFISLFVSANDGTKDYFSSATDEYTPFNDDFTNTNGIDSDPLKSFGYQINGDSVKLAAGATQGAIVSKAMPTEGEVLPGGIAWMQLTTTQTIPTGTNIQYFISGDGGQNWHPLNPNEKLYTPQIGYKLRLKALLTSDGTTTPVIDDWKLTIRFSYFKDVILYNYQFYKTENGLRGLSCVEKICDDTNSKIVLRRNSEDSGKFYISGTFRTERKELAGKATQVCLTTSATCESFITYKVTADNGAHWQTILPSTTGTPTVLDYPGNTLCMEVTLNRVSDNVSPSLDSMNLQVYQDILGDRIINVQLVNPPSNLTARAKINYKTILTWDASKLPNGQVDPNVTYNVYKKKCTLPSDAYFEPGDEGVICIPGIKDTFYSDFNIDYGATYYYLVTAVKDFTVGTSTVSRESTPTSNAYATVVSQNELDKQLGLEDYWGYSGFRSGAGDGYININTGNLVYQATDLIVTGPRLAMVMRRTYNSQSTSRSALGDGWDFSFNTCLLIEYENDGVTEKGLILKDGDGSIHRFTDTDHNGIYNSSEYIYMKITKTAKTDENGTYYEYKLTRKDDIEYNFDRNLLLTSFSEPNGNKIYLHYDHRGNIDEVYNDVDDHIYLLYDKGDRLYAVTDGIPEYNAEGAVTNIVGGRTYIYEQVDPTDLRDVQLRSAALWDRSGTNSTWTNRVLTHKDEYWYYPVSPNNPIGSNLASIYDPRSTASNKNTLTHLSYNYFTEADGTKLPVISEVKEPNNDFYTVDITGDNTQTTEFDPTGATITDNYSRYTSYVHNPSGQITQVTNTDGKSVNYTYASPLNPYAPTEVKYITKVYNRSTGQNEDTAIISSYDYNNNGDVLYAKSESQKVGSLDKTLLSYTSYEYYQNDTNALKNNKLHYTRVQKSQTDPFDVLTTEYDYDTYGNLVYINAPPSESGGSNRVTRYSYYNDNLMNGSVIEQYRIGLQKNCTDEFYGKRTEYSYDNKGRLNSTKVQIGSGTNYTTISESGAITYDEFNQPLVVTDELGNMTAYKYDAFGMPLEVKKQKNDNGNIVDLNITTYEYDQNFNLLYQSSGLGTDIAKTYFEYDVMDRPIATWQLAKIDTVNSQGVEKYIASLSSYQTTTSGEDIVKSYSVKDYVELADKASRPQQIQNLMGLSSNYVTESRYDKLGRLTRTIVNGVTMAENTDFDDSGNVLSQKITVDIPTNKYRINNAYYDALGRAVKTVTDVGGKNTTTMAQYDFFGLETITTDPLGKATVNNYDYIGRLTKVTLPTKSDGVHNDTTVYQYDISGTINIPGTTNTIAVFGNMVTDANGHEKVTWMDRAGRKVREDTIADNSAFNLYTNYTYGDPNGTTDETKGYTSQVKKVQRNDKFTYDQNGVKTGRMSGSFEYYYYDDLGRKDTIAFKNTEGAGSDYIHYVYDNIGYTTRGVLHKVVNGDVIEEITATIPDKLGRTTDATESKEINGVVEDGSLHIQFEYDAWGNTTKTIHTLNDNGASPRTTQYVYNADNRLQDVLYDDASTTPKPVRNYAYRTDGSVSTITDYREFSLTGAYIARAYDYYSNGQVKTMTYTDSTSNDTTKKRETHTLTYYDNGLLQNEHIVNEYTGKNMKDITKAYTYDDISRLLTSNITELDGNDTNTLSDTYTYDGVGNRLTMHYVRNAENNDEDENYTLTYNYNEFNQLENITKTGMSSNLSTFEYDGRGNQFKEITKQKYNNDYYDVTTEYHYDLMGNMTTLIQTPSYEYDRTRNMTQTNEYNAMGQRVSKSEVTVQKSTQDPDDEDDDITLPTEFSRYYYSGSALLFSTRNDLEENILTPGGQVIASQRMDSPYNGDYLYYNYDIRSSTTNLIRPDDGLSVQNYVYDEFGNVTESQDTINNDLQYTGSVKDKKSGLNYMNSRFYEPSTGRFLSQDTYKGNAYSPMSQHLYSYTGNNPTNYVDPTGHSGDYIPGMPSSDFNNYAGNMISHYWNSDKAGKDLNTDFLMLQFEAQVFGSVKVMDFGPDGKSPLIGMPASKVNAIQHLAEDSIIVDPNIVSDKARDQLEILTGGNKDALQFLTSDDISTLIDHYKSVDPTIRSMNDWCWEHQGICEGILQVLYGFTYGALGMDTCGGGGTSSGVADAELADAEVGSANSVNRVDALYDGMTMGTNEALDEASSFLGEGYTDVGRGRFLSADGTRAVRMGDNDILGKHADGPHINFEILGPNPYKLGKMMVLKNFHIFIN